MSDEPFTAIGQGAPMCSSKSSGSSTNGQHLSDTIGQV
ncbi:hypothetical protein BSU04_27485 [Caballeronia sordidicola]|uniref:Uncharacterized protein n=1 Tax=Caballeronia sordidicola TaxID=196367 RepID=A0A226WVW0_CABSO|nr:hypothetical protein BSU04_27485 [Caballeronia sordidicola]